MATAFDVNDLNPQGLWYCHGCQENMVPNLDDFSCSRCNGGFIEPVPDLPTSAETDTSVQELTSEGGAEEGEEGEIEGAATAGEGMGRGVTQTRRRTGSHGMVLHRTPVRRTRSLHRPQQPAVGQLPSPYAAVGTHFQTFMNQFLSGLAGGGAFNGGMINIQIQPPIIMGENMAGNPNDYVWTQGGLDNIITMLMNRLDGSGPPPAAKDLIESLPSVPVDKQQVESRVQCHVCMEDFVIDELVRRLPCSHCFHTDCIVPWLELHGTCPICRCRLEAGAMPPQAASNSTNESGEYELQQDTPYSTTNQSSGPPTFPSAPPDPARNRPRTFEDEYD